MSANDPKPKFVGSCCLIDYRGVTIGRRLTASDARYERSRDCSGGPCPRRRHMDRRGRDGHDRDFACDPCAMPTEGQALLEAVELHVARAVTWANPDWRGL